MIFLTESGLIPLTGQVLLLTAFCVSIFASKAKNEIQYENIFSSGDLAYGNLLVDTASTSLYVGAHGHLFRLWLYNINDTSSSNLFAKRKLDVKEEERDECLRMGNSEMECAHRVRILFRKNGGQLLLCSASGMKPQLSTLDAATLTDVEAPKTIIGVCSPHETLNTTAVYSESGNPDNLSALYSGIRTGLSLENHLIYRPPLMLNNREVHGALRTVYTDSKWLNEPQFVAAFDTSRYVYFFFREVAIEADTFSGSAPIVCSRVARICKTDLGGGNVLRQVWTSFMKTRLNCSLTKSGGGIPFHFDHIQSVSRLDESSDTYFYATFTTAENHFQASAVCVFSLNAINRIFDSGAFLEQTSPISIWLPTPTERVPANRPGACSSDSRQMSDEDLQFAKTHMLMADAADGGTPIFTRYNDALTKIVVDRRDDRRVVVFVLSPHRRELLKIRHLRRENAIGDGRLLGVYTLPFTSVAVRDLAILPGEFLYVADAQRVAQYRVGQCAMHVACAWCAADPYCAWNLARSACVEREPIHSTAIGWITASSNGDVVEEKCRNYVRTYAYTVYPGDAMLLECMRETGAKAKQSRTQDYRMPRWRIDRREIDFDADEHVVYTADGGLVLLNLTTSQSGMYQCIVGDMPTVEYTITVDDEDCARPKSVEQFRSAQREWCKKYSNYRANLSRWQDFYEKNNQHCSGGNTETQIGDVTYA